MVNKKAKQFAQKTCGCSFEPHFLSMLNWMRFRSFRKNSDNRSWPCWKWVQPPQCLGWKLPDPITWVGLPSPDFSPTFQNGFRFANFLTIPHPLENLWGFHRKCHHQWADWNCFAYSGPAKMAAPEESCVTSTVDFLLLIWSFLKIKLAIFWDAKNDATNEASAAGAVWRPAGSRTRIPIFPNRSCHLCWPNRVPLWVPGLALFDIEPPHPKII